MFVIPIPTSGGFIQQWHAWIMSEVSKCFLKNRERIDDTFQGVCLRLIQKDFIGRWFFKHLRNELVDRTQAELMLGRSIVNVKALKPTHGDRKDHNSLWKIDDILEFANFDYDSYYYSAQNHTIDSDRVLQLLGHEAGRYSALQSLWRQNKLLPSELTEHECVFDNDECKICMSGLRSIRNRGVSLNSKSDWNSHDVKNVVSKLRWNDKQLIPLLKTKKRNFIVCVPKHIIRLTKNSKYGAGIDAGLLSYASKIIRNATCNDFKHMTRTDDLSKSVFYNGRCSPEFSDSESIAIESDENEVTQRVFRDISSMSKFSDFEISRDLEKILSASGLLDEEIQVIRNVDLDEVSVRSYAIKSGKAAQRVHRSRASAFRKIRNSVPVNTEIKDIVDSVCLKYDCTIDDITGPAICGSCVVARTELYNVLLDSGWCIGDIINKFNVSEDRVVAAVNRRIISDMRQ